MKKSTVLRIASSPMSFPYFDIDALRAVEPMNVRCKVSMSEPNEQLAEQYGLDKDRVPEIIQAQYMAGRYVRQKIGDKGLTNVAVSEETGLDKTLLSKYIQGERPLSPNVANLVPLCYGVLQEACHKVMMGYVGKIVLPSVYAETARALSQASAEKRAELLRKALVQKKLYENLAPTKYRFAPHRSPATLIRERIYELLYDKGIQGYLLLGKETPYDVRNYLKQFTRDGYEHDNPRLGYLMYIAFETDLALDYFIAEDFTLYTPCFYKEGEELVEIKDRDILQYVGVCAEVPTEQRVKLIGDAMAISLSVSETE